MRQVSCELSYIRLLRYTARIRGIPENPVAAAAVCVVGGSTEPPRMSVSTGSKQIWADGEVLTGAQYDDVHDSRPQPQSVTAVTRGRSRGRDGDVGTAPFLGVVNMQMMQ